MKKLILSLMLIMGSLSFSNDRDRGKDSQNFEELKLRAEISSEQKSLKETSKKSRSIIPNIFNYVDPLDGDDK